MSRKRLGVADDPPGLMTDAEFEAAPVKDLRKDMPVWVKVHVVARQRGMCACRDKQAYKLEPCGKHLLEDDNLVVHFNHDPPLGVRPKNKDTRDFEPPQNDPEWIFAVRGDCHDRITNGATGGGGRGTDIGEVTRLKRIERRKRQRAKESGGVTLEARGRDLLRRSVEAASPHIKAAIQTVLTKTAERVIGGALAGKDEARQPEKGASKGRLKGRGFQTNRSSPYKAKIGGGIVRRKKETE